MKPKDKKKTLNRLIEKLVHQSGRKRSEIIEALAAFVTVGTQNIYLWLNEDKPSWTSSNRERRLWGYFGYELTGSKLVPLRAPLKSHQSEGEESDTITRIRELSQSLQSVQQAGRVVRARRVSAIVEELLLMDPAHVEQDRSLLEAQQELIESQVQLWLENFQMFRRQTAFSEEKMKGREQWQRSLREENEKGEQPASPQS